MPFFWIDLANLAKDDIEVIGIVEAPSEEDALNKLGVRSEERLSETEKETKRIMIDGMDLHLQEVAQISNREQLLHWARHHRRCDPGV